LLVFMFFRQVKNLGDNFSYIVADDDSREAAVVDSSYNADEIAVILKSKNFKLKYIINTHGHSDHTAGNAELRAEFGGQTVANESSKPTPDVAVADGEIIVIGVIRIKVIHTPGHTQGSICIYMESKRLVIAGDLLVNRFGLKLPSRAFTVDMYREARSLQKLAGMEFDIVCFGHGRPLVKNAHASVAGFARQVNARFT